MTKFYLFFILISLTSCTYSINLVHTEGSASDVVDDTITPSTSLSIPTIPGLL